MHTAKAMTYCKAGETPGYRDVVVVDLDTGREVSHVIEVNTAEGWLRRYASWDGISETRKDVREVGNFEIRGKIRAG